MTESFIKLKVPKSALTIPTNVLEQHVIWLCDLIIKYGSSNLELDKIVSDYEVQKKEIKLSLERQHNQQIEELKQQIKSIYADANELSAEKHKSILVELENRNTTIADLNKQISSLRKTITKELLSDHNEEIKKEKDRITESMQLRIDQLNILNSELKQQIKLIRTDVETINADRIKSLQLSLQHETDTKNKVIEDLKSQFYNEKKSMEKLYSSQIANLETTISDYRSRQDQLSSISEIIKPLTKFYSGSNEEKGTSGENLIANILRTHDRYLDGSVTDTSGQASKGDLFFRWRQLKCMIEIKNKKVITVGDMDKFHSNVTTLANSINCAVFISLNTDVFPGRTRESLQIDFINSTTVMYVYLSNNDALHYVLACLEKIVVSNSSNEEQTKLLAKYFIDCFNHINTVGKFYEKQIISKNKEIKQIAKQLEINNKLYKEMHPTYLKLAGVIDIETESEQEDTPDPEVSDTKPKRKSIKLNILYPDDCIKKIKEIYINLLTNNEPHSLTDLLDLLQIDKTTLDSLGGYDELTASAELDYTASIITDDVVKKILEFKETNGVDPTRKDIVQKKILTDASIRRLFSVIKTKKQIDYIINYCNTFTTPIEPEVEQVIKKKKKKKVSIDSNRETPGVVRDPVSDGLIL